MNAWDEYNDDPEPWRRRPNSSDSTRLAMQYGIGGVILVLALVIFPPTRHLMTGLVDLLPKERPVGTAPT